MRTTERNSADLELSERVSRIARDSRQPECVKKDTKKVTVVTSAKAFVEMGVKNRVKSLI